MELAALDLARRVVRASRLRAGRADLGHPPTLGLEQVRVRRHVHDSGEAGMRDRAVVALEEVLRADLPVGRELGLGSLKEAEGADVDACSCDALGNVLQDVGERGRVRIRVDEEERSPLLEPKRDEPELDRVSMPPSRAERGAARSLPSRPYVQAWYGHWRRRAASRSPRTRASLGAGRR